MYITNQDYDYLKQLADNDEVLAEMVGRLAKQKELSNEKIRKAIAERRKIDKNYARSKKENNG